MPGRLLAQILRLGSVTGLGHPVAMRKASLTTTAGAGQSTQERTELFSA